MVCEAIKQSMAWMETDYSRHTTHFRWKIKWQPEHLGALGIMGETAPGEWVTCEGSSQRDSLEFHRELLLSLHMELR